MSYNYFSKQLLDSNVLNLSEVFPVQQEEARNTLRVTYGLGDIVLYLKDVTQDFNRTEVKYIDLDNAIQSIVKKYYNSKNEVNPFKVDLSGVIPLDEGTVPREAAIVTGKGELKGKGVAKAAKSAKAESMPETTPMPPAPMPEPEVVMTASEFDAELEKGLLEGQITVVEENPELFEDADTMQMITDQIISVFSFDDEETKKWFEQKGFDYNKYNK